MSSDFLIISDPKIWSIQVKECHEPLVDLKNLNFKISSNRAAYYSGYTKVRQSIATKLQQAMLLLPNKLTFLFSEGHRPISLQRSMYQEYYDHLAKNYPQWDEKTLKKETAKYIAPPQDVPPHSTGGAIDITLATLDGKELDMGSILDDLPEQNEYRNFTAANNISEMGKANRKILIEVLSEVGFVNYPAEWWHWSYGDKYWAYHTNAPCAIYDSIE